MRGGKLWWKYFIFRENWKIHFRLAINFISNDSRTLLRNIVAKVVIACHQVHLSPKITSVLKILSVIVRSFPQNKRRFPKEFHPSRKKINTVHQAARQKKIALNPLHCSNSLMIQPQHRGSMRIEELK